MDIHLITFRESVLSTLHVHTLMKFTAHCSLEDVCVCVCVRACVCLIIAVRWMKEEGGGNCAADVGRIEQQGASSVTVAVN